METNEFNTQNEQSTHCSQPVSEMQQAKPAPPDNYLALAILSTLFCCLPLGIVSIVYSAKVNNLWVMGHYDEARRTARKAKKWALASIFALVAFVVLYVLLVVVLGVCAYSIQDVDIAPFNNINI
jgi:hypothetical protein